MTEIITDETKLKEAFLNYIECVTKLKQENKELKEKLEEYEEMAKKGLEEFKDVGGCWGCGIQLVSDAYSTTCKKYKQAFEEIRDLLNQVDDSNWLHTDKHIYMDDKCIQEIKSRIATKINEVLK